MQITMQNHRLESKDNKSSTKINSGTRFYKANKIVLDVPKLYESDSHSDNKVYPTNRITDNFDLLPSEDD